jgi:hypothetical protein
MFPRADEPAPRRAPTYAIALLPFVLVALVALVALLGERRETAAVRDASDAGRTAPNAVLSRSASDP